MSFIMNALPKFKEDKDKDKEEEVEGEATSIVLSVKYQL